MATPSLNPAAARALAFIESWYAASQAPLTISTLRAGMDGKKSTIARTVLELEAAGVAHRTGAHCGKTASIHPGLDRARQKAAQKQIEASRAWRRMPRPGDLRVAGDAPARRKCLNCARPFDSEGWGDRLCDPCGDQSAAMI